MAPSKKKKKSSSSAQKADVADSSPAFEQKSTANPATPILDPNGTVQVARGVSSASQAKKQYKQLVSKTAKEPAVQQFLHSDLDQKRLEILKKDDANPNVSKLSDKQQRALAKRRKPLNRKATDMKIIRQETKRLQAAVDAAKAVDILQTDEAGLLEVETDMERTTKVTQVDLKRKYLDEETSRHIYDLKFATPYGMQYDRSGRYSILYGQTNGHAAVMDCHQQCLVTEYHVGERIRDACFLHNFTLHAVAQTNHVYVYDHTGAEVHRLADHNDPTALQFLPYHWLLASIGRTGWLKYQDTSTGQLVSQHRTKLGSCSVLRQNPQNAVLHAGHSNGTVTLWSPANSKYLAKILCHKGAAIHSLAIDPAGRTMVTGGADRQVRVWDLRTYKELHSYFTIGGIPSTLDISQRGILGIGHAGHATFWSAEALRTKVKEPYMHHLLAGQGPIETLRFRPFEDVCGLGHAKGISSIVIPGSGEPSLDTAEYNTNPLQDVKQRREAEVRALLDKLRPEMIALDPNQVGGIEESDPHSRLERVRDEQENANAREDTDTKKQKTKKRGRSKIQTQLRRKRKNVIDENTIKLREAREKEKATNAAETTEGPVETPKESAPAALKRFF